MRNLKPHNCVQLLLAWQLPLLHLHHVVLAEGGGQGHLKQGLVQVGHLGLLPHWFLDWLLAW